MSYEPETEKPKNPPTTPPADPKHPTDEDGVK